MWALVNDQGEVERVLRRPQPVTIDDVYYPDSIFHVWSAAQLRALGFLPVRAARAPDPVFFRSGTPAYVMDGDHVVEAVPTLPRPVGQVREGLKRRVEAIRDRIVAGGIEWVDGAETYIVETDPRSLSNLTSMAATFGQGEAPAGFKWRARDNRHIALTDAAGLMALARAVAGHVNAAYVASWDKKAAIDASDFDALLTLDLESGWPETAGKGGGGA